MGNQNGNYAGAELSSYRDQGRPVTLPGKSSAQSNMIPLQTEILTLPPNNKPGRVEMYDYSNLKGARDIQRAFDNAAAAMYVKLKSAADKADEAFNTATASGSALAAYNQKTTTASGNAQMAYEGKTTYVSPKYEFSSNGRPVTLPGYKGGNTETLPLQTEILVLPPNHTSGPVEMINYSGIQHLGGFDPMSKISKVAGNNYAYGTLSYHKGFANYI